MTLIPVIESEAGISVNSVSSRLTRYIKVQTSLDYIGRHCLWKKEKRGRKEGLDRYN